MLVDGSLHGVTWGASQFVALGFRSGTDVAAYDHFPPLIVTSPDGVTWTQRDAPGSRSLEDVVWSGDRFVAVGYSGILTSSDGVKWSQQRIPVDGSLEGVTWGGDQFVAVGTIGGLALNSGLILTSPDGIAWKQRRSPARGLLPLDLTHHLRDVAWSGSRFAIVGEVRSYGIVAEYKPSILTSP